MTPFKSIWYSITLVICVAGTTGLFAQQQGNLEIIDQDGQRVSDDLKNQAADARPGKIIILDGNGQRREIDVAGAKSIIVNKSVSSIMKNGEEQKQVSGKAIIIGPDGQRQEFDLGDDLFGGEAGVIGKLQIEPFQNDLWRLPGNLHIQKSEGASKFAIGVHCREVSDALRAHIDLEEGVGLVVTNDPIADSPAAKAGILQHDILMYADQTPLSKMSDLTALIEAAGTQKQPLSISLQRKGKEIGVTLTPVQRSSIDSSKLLFHPGFKFQLDEVGPGMILELDHDRMIEGIMKKMDAMDDQFQKRMDDFMTLRNELNEALQKQNDQ